ncbi:MAG: hypothetical protein HYS86_00665 [Candidatus Chisholmbacteria bacterium]|nr:hypothetical protein [Candidatus Chisholmbacteria bacterium]
MLNETTDRGEGAGNQPVSSQPPDLQLSTQEEKAEVVEEAVRYTTSFIYGAFQGECLQFGEDIFHDTFAATTGDYKTRHLLGKSRQISHVLPLTLVEKLRARLGQKDQPYILLGVFHHDVKTNTTTLLMGGNISWESGILSPLDLPKGPNPRANSPTVIGIQFDSSEVGARFVAALEDDPDRVLGNFLRHQHFSQSWIAHGPFTDSYVRSTQTPNFRFAIDDTQLLELPKPFGFSPRGISF